MEVEMETESMKPLASGDPDPSTGEGDQVKEGPDESSSDITDRSTEEVMPELTVVLIGDTNSVETGSKNLLLDHDEQTAAVDEFTQFSSKLYDLCGRHISVINMLGLQHAEQLEQESLSHIDQIVHEQGIQAFLLLLPNGQHVSHYTSGLQWLEKIFGKGSLAFVMTVVTHESDEKCESALAGLKAFSDIDEKRFHTCTKSMRDETEIIALLEKIDVMVSENETHCYSGPMCVEEKEQKQNLKLDHESQEEERTTGSVFQQTTENGEILMLCSSGTLIKSPQSQILET
ncbi:GTPase IMAP family member 6-like [Centroberyx affinis]|uniref:GTPase IMAP family member 6-like n=1 Tax=Centroberyx affinis TaxID=166261 RepID=UPI003A5C58E3